MVKVSLRWHAVRLLQPGLERVLALWQKGMERNQPFASQLGVDDRPFRMQREVGVYSSELRTGHRGRTITWHRVGFLLADALGTNKTCQDNRGLL